MYLLYGHYKQQIKFIYRYDTMTELQAVIEVACLF